MARGHWTARLDALAREVMVRAEARAAQHERAARTAKKWNDCFLIITGVLGLVGGTVSLFPRLADSAWSAGIGAGAGYVVGLITVLDSTWRLAETQSNCALAQASYTAVSQDVRYQLSLPRHLRPDAREYVHAKLDKMVELGLTSPLVAAPAAAGAAAGDIGMLAKKDAPESESSSDGGSDDL